MSIGSSAVKGGVPLSSSKMRMPSAHQSTAQTHARGRAQRFEWASWHGRHGTGVMQRVAGACRA
eukprot:3323584-Pleurochrysis_carterae.AAC.1